MLVCLTDFDILGIVDMSYYSYIIRKSHIWWWCVPNKTAFERYLEGTVKAQLYGRSLEKAFGEYICILKCICASLFEIQLCLTTFVRLQMSAAKIGTGIINCLAWCKQCCSIFPTESSIKPLLITITKLDWRQIRHDGNIRLRLPRRLNCYSFACWGHF